MSEKSLSEKDELAELRKQLTPMQRKFAQNYVDGMRQGGAYHAAGYKGHRGNASTLRSKEIVSRYIELLEEEVDNSFIRKRRKLTGKAYENYDLILEYGSPELKAAVSKDILSKSWEKPASKHEHSGNIKFEIDYGDDDTDS